jgi:two-component system nitrogen regulation response regulator GlnG
MSSKGLAASVERHLRDYFAAHENGLPCAGLYERILQEIERPLLSVTLAECRGNQLCAAALLGLNRNTLRKKIRDLGLDAGCTRKNRGSVGKGGAAND